MVDVLKWVIWCISFFTLYLSVFWIQIIYTNLVKEKYVLKKLPLISLIVPALNEEKSLAKTVYSILNCDYPKEKLEILIVDHGSTDKTEQIAKNIIKEFPDYTIKLLHLKRQNHHIKAHALNYAMKYVKGDLIGCVDADTLLMPQCLKEIVPIFKNKKVGAVISTIKVIQPKNFLEKIQHLEYLFSTFIRSLMSKIDTLHITPGALSVYRTKLVRKYHGFDEKNVTEDLEMAMRLRYYGYKVKIALKSVTYTRVPNTLKSHWAQRVRWYRGFIYNNLKYKKMLFKKKHGLMGYFQLPINFVTVFIVILMFILMSYEFIRILLRWINKFLIAGLDVFIFDLPTLKQLMLQMNLTLVFPIIVSFFIGLLIYHSAHKTLKEQWRYPIALITYMFLYPVLRAIQWLIALFEESFKVRKKW